ncbi:MAG: hypothetical protein ABI356_01585 [Steroidobacteraceae bacterium]
MSRKIVAIFSNPTLILLTAFGLVGVGQAQNSKTPYAKMAPINQYLMTESAEIALARSAAPASISGDATIVVLKQNGYETVVKGKNGFVCIVERSWMSPFDWPEFWNPKMRGPICFNPAAVRSVLPYTYKRTDLILDGLSKAQIIERLKQVVAKKEVPALEPGAMCYMMSREQILGDAGGHWHPHLMIYGPRSDSADWGSDLAGVPVYLNPQFQNSPEPLGTFMVVVDQWSDGTPAPIRKASVAGAKDAQGN